MEDTARPLHNALHVIFTDREMFSQNTNLTEGCYRRTLRKKA
jgi:hypothetical protein